MNNLVLPCSLPMLTHRGWPARPRPVWQVVETAMQTGCIMAGCLREAEKEACFLFENVCVLFCLLSQRSDSGEPKTLFPLHPAFREVARDI